MDPASPQDVGIRWLAAMRAGDWEAAWRQTDRLEAARRVQQCRDPAFVRQPHHLVWDGSSFDGRTLRVRCEHGLGDTLQSLRFLPCIAGRCRALHLMVQPPLVALLQGAPGLGTVHDGWRGPESWPDCDVEAEVTELAYATRATAADVPPPYPHLAQQVQQCAPWTPDDDPRLRVAVFWSASGWDASRSIDPTLLAPWFALPGLRWFDLQQDVADTMRLPGPAEPLWQRTRAVEAAAAVLARMDLVVCVDGMPAHLAATLGVPTWVLLKHEADWRWGAAGGRTPWYPAMRLFRQPLPGDWASAVAQVTAALGRREGLPTRAAGTGRPAGAQAGAMLS
jgi:hypothetical protein